MSGVYANIPDELKDLKCWVCWRYECKKGKDRADKIPYNPMNGKKAMSNNPNTWGSFQQAVKAVQTHDFSGIGFVFCKENNIIGVDIDHCRNKDTGEINETAKTILDKYPSYTEISPSGEGLHIFYKSQAQIKGCKNTKTGIEMYAHSRYFTMTGNALHGMPETISSGKEAIPWIYENYIKKSTEKNKLKQSQKNTKSFKLSDDEILQKAKNSQKSEEFTALWEGNWQDKYASHSEADLALCMYLAFWSGKDKEQMDRLFRKSKLYRKKWDEVHHSDGSTYGEETIKRAIEVTDDIYSPKKASGILEQEGMYFRVKGESIYPITNFVIKPVEMIVAEDETQMTADLVTVRKEMFRQVMSTTDFNNIQKFKNILNKKTISLSFLGSESDLELLKGYVSQMDWVLKKGVKAMGIYEHKGKLVYVTSEGAVSYGGFAVDDIVQLEKYKSISSNILSFSPVEKQKLLEFGQNALSYNEPAKTVSIIAWICGCFIKPHLKMQNIKFPHLLLIGEQGSGKSNTLEQVILPVFSNFRVRAAAQVTPFTLLKESASSNIIPHALDEFKPSKMDKARLNALYNHLRDAYDGHEGLRGKSDQSTLIYELSAPVILAGEESPEEAAIRERSIELLFSKKDISTEECKKAYRWMCKNSKILGSLGRSLLDAALGTKKEEAAKWFEDGEKCFYGIFPSRIVHNLACCYAGLCLAEKMFLNYGLLWEEVFSIKKNRCINYLCNAAKEYLLEGGTHNKSVVEQTLEVMSRMSLEPNIDYVLSPDNKTLSIRLNKVYDKYTKYRKDYAVSGEILPYNQFKKQLLHTDFLIESNASKRFGQETHRVWVLNYEILSKRCDVSGFENTDVEPL